MTITELVWLSRPASSAVSGIVSLRAYEKYPEHVLKRFSINTVSPHDSDRIQVQTDRRIGGPPSKLWIPREWAAEPVSDGLEAAYIGTSGSHADQLLWTIGGADTGRARLAHYSSPEVLEETMVLPFESLRVLTDEERAELLRPFYEYLSASE